MNRANLLVFKGVLYRAWQLNLYRPDLTAPIPRRVWRMMGAA
jgi:hypothetical protein